MSQRIWFLKRCDLFEQLTAEQLSQLEAHGQVRRYERNSAIYLPGDHPGVALCITCDDMEISFKGPGRRHPPPR